MLYRVPAETMLRRVSYHGGLPFACPLALDVRCAAGATHRAEYVPGSMTDCPAARYVVEGRLCELRPSDGPRAAALASG